MRRALNLLNSTNARIRFRSTTSLVDKDSTKDSIDKSEVEKLSKWSHTWWDEERGDLKPLHAMNKLRVQLMRDCLVYARDGNLAHCQSLYPLKDMKILDVGCGGGILTEALSRIGAQVTGIEPSVELIEAANDHASQDPEVRSRIHYIVGSIEEHATTVQNEYDAVVTSEVIEHLDEKELFLEACAKTIKPGGSIFVTTMNKTTVAWLAAIITGEYLLNVVPRGTHDWEKFISPKETQYILEKYGCYTKLVHGMFYNFLCNEWSWTSNTGISYALHAVKKQ